MQYKKIVEAYAGYSNLLKQFGRRPNFPEAISEKMASVFLPGSKRKEKGDLWIGQKRIEVKSFAGLAPTSFGPNQSWDYIMFLDCQDLGKISAYLNTNSSNSLAWKKLLVNKKETFGEQCEQKRRPRLKFSRISSQVSLIHLGTTSFENILDEKLEENGFELVKAHGLIFWMFCR